MQQVDQKILFTLLKLGRSSFRNLQENTAISPRILRAHLDQLIEKKFINEDGRQNRKQGQRLWYSLTLKGESITAKLAIEDIASTTKNVAEIVKILAHDPEKIKLLREAMNIASLSFSSKMRNKVKAMDHNPTVEEIKPLVDKYVDETTGPITESLRDIYNIYMKVKLPKTMLDKDRYALGFRQDGGICLLSVSLLKKHGLGKGL